MKLRRKKLVIQDIENQLYKCERRIEALARQAYELRKILKMLQETEKAIQNLPVGETNAVYFSNSEEQLSGGTTDNYTGQPELSNFPVANPILEEQPTELPTNQ